MEAVRRIYAAEKFVTIISSNGLPPARHQAITPANDDVLSIGPQEQIEEKLWLQIFSFTKTRLKMSAKY